MYQTTCANVLQDVGRMIYMYHEKARLIYQSAVVGAALKSKGDHTTVGDIVY